MPTCDVTHVMLFFALQYCIFRETRMFYAINYYIERLFCFYKSAATTERHLKLFGELCTCKKSIDKGVTIHTCVQCVHQVSSSASSSNDSSCLFFTAGRLLRFDCWSLSFVESFFFLDATFKSLESVLRFAGFRNTILLSSAEHDQNIK